MSKLVDINDDLITENEAAEILGLAVSTLQKYRVSGEGPKFIKFKRRVRYTKRLCYDWINTKVVSDTSKQAS